MRQPAALPVASLEDDAPGERIIPWRIWARQQPGTAERRVFGKLWEFSHQDVVPDTLLLSGRVSS